MQGAGHAAVVVYRKCPGTPQIQPKCGLQLFQQHLETHQVEQQGKYFFKLVHGQTVGPSRTYGCGKDTGTGRPVTIYTTSSVNYPIFL